ncbi:MAG: NAD(P)/FAD-dependent oxidoreductase [Acetanaerobacterium sp.]
MQNSYDVIVIGAGAAGLMAAGTAAGQGKSTLLLERNDRPAKKVLITGKGRCNVTNNCTQEHFITQVKTNGRFLYSAIAAFAPQDTMAFFERLGLPLKTERGNRVFPVSDRAADVAEALMRYAKEQGAQLTTARAQALVVEDGAVRGVVTQDGHTLAARAVVVATGGLSYPQTGSTGDGYRLARQAGHTVTPASPALIPIVANEDWCRRAMGLSLKNVTLTVVDDAKEKTVYSELGEMLFTHFGVSGPLVLSASSAMEFKRLPEYRLLIDLKPALSPEQLDRRIQRDFSQNLNRDFQNSLGALLPKKMIPVIVYLSGISPDAKVNQITKEMRARLVQTMKSLCVTPRAFRPIEEAVITSGGVKISEIDPKTMRSKLCGGLHFAGEVIDVDAYTGGYNLQIAFSTGYLAGLHA